MGRTVTGISRLPVPTVARLSATLPRALAWIVGTQGLCQRLAWIVHALQFPCPRLAHCASFGCRRGGRGGAYERSEERAVNFQFYKPQLTRQRF
jgi:hypothetical protein